MNTTDESKPPMHNGMTAHDESNERWQDRCDALTKELADAKLSLECANRVTLETAKERDYFEEQFHAARAEAEKLRAALERLRDGDFVGTPINRGCGAMMLIDQALESTSPPPKT
jgi:hypothetical protein